MANIILTGQQCSEVSEVGEYLGVRFNCSSTNSSELVTQDPCCPTCATPVVVSDLYVGATLIPYSLNMPDGTSVSYAGNTTTTFDGKGVLTLAVALVEDDSVVISVASNNCTTESCPVVVKSSEDECDCPIYNPCSINVNSLGYEVVDNNYGKISKLNVSSSGSLKYKLDSGEWKTNWNDINNFLLSDEHTLYIKVTNNPTCNIELPLVVLDRIIEN